MLAIAVIVLILAFILGAVLWPQPHKPPETTDYIGGGCTTAMAALVILFLLYAVLSATGVVSPP